MQILYNMHIRMHLFPVKLFESKTQVHVGSKVCKIKKYEFCKK